MPHLKVYYTINLLYAPSPPSDTIEGEAIRLDLGDVKMTAPLAQIIIAFDGAKIRVESPGANGQRQKIEGISFADLPIEIRAALSDQLDRARASKRAKLMAVQGQNIQYVAENHDTALARKIWGNGVAESRVMRARLRYSSEKAGNVDETGKLKTAPRPKKELPPPMEL
jgi:hypothetical protein